MKNRIDRIREKCEKYSFWILWFMVALYPLIVIPNDISFQFRLDSEVMFNVPPNYFYMPRYFILAAAALCSLWILLYMSYKKLLPLERRWELLPLVLFLLFGFISASLAGYPVTAWVGTPMRWSGFTVDLFCIALFLLAWYIINREGLLNSLVKWFCVSAAVVSFLALLQYCFGIYLVPYEEFRYDMFVKSNTPFGTMANPNFYGTFVVMALPAAWMLFLYKYRSLQWLLITMLIYAGLLVSLTRGVWLTGCLMFVITAAYVLFNRQNFDLKTGADLIAKRKKAQKGIFDNFSLLLNQANSWLAGLNLKKAFAVVVVAFILVTAVLVPVDDFRLLGRAATVPGEIAGAVEGDDYAGSQRIYIWKEVLRVLTVSWDVTLFGVGPDHLIYFKILTLSGGLVDKAHNIFLERAVTQGVLALAFYLVFMGVVLYRLHRYGYMGFLLWLVIVSYLVQGFFNIETVMTVPIFWIILGLAMAYKDKCIKNDI